MPVALNLPIAPTDDQAWRRPESIAHPVGAQAIILQPGMTVQTAFGHIMAACIRQIRGNETGVLQGVDPECIHQMRVGIRRLRSAIRLFARVVPISLTLKQELRWLSEALGSARDADVLVGSTLPPIVDACPAEADWPLLMEVAVTNAQLGRQKAAEAIGSTRYSRLMMDLIEWLDVSHRQDTNSTMQSTPQDKCLARTAERILRRRHAKLIEHGERLTQATPEERHQVRIAAKMARYSTEFFQSIFPATRTRAYVKDLSALQDALGRLNDTAVAVQLLCQIQQQADHEIATAAAFARGHLLAGTQQDLARLARRWKRFESGTRPPFH